MKLSVSLLAASTVTAWQRKEWEVQDAYFADEEIVLSDPTTRSNKQWHECGDKPPVPWNGRDVACSGAYCAAVCPKGWRSQGRWRIKCQDDNTWAHSKFSPCITCPDMSDQLSKIGERNASSQSIFRKNLPVTQFFCGDSSNKLGMQDEWFKKGGFKRNVKCECKNGQNGDPWWKKSCAWSFRGAPWSPSDVNSVQCKPKEFQIPTTWPIGVNNTPRGFNDLTVNPHYEVSIDLKLKENNNKGWSNVFGFRTEGTAAHDEYGAYIPAVQLHEESTRLFVCAALNDKANTCWSTDDDMPVNSWFNLRIKQYYDGSDYLWKTFIDGELANVMVNNNPTTFRKVDGILGNQYRPEKHYKTAVGDYRDFKFRTSIPQYCVKMTSGPSSECENHPEYTSWSGGSAKVRHNGEVVGVMAAGSRDFEYCLDADQVDFVNDSWEFVGPDLEGICITSLTINDEPVLVGPNDDLSTFWLDANGHHCLDNSMSTPLLDVRNGEVYYSECKNDIIRANTPLWEGTVHPNYELKIELNLEDTTETRWSNIFGFRQQGADDLQTPGYRIPSVRMRYDEPTSKNLLNVCTAAMNKGVWCSDIRDNIPFNEWFSLTIKQEKNEDGQFIYSISMNGVLHRSWTNTHPMTFENVEGFLANDYAPQNAYKVPAGRYQNFQFTTSPDVGEGEIITPNMMVYEGVTVYPTYEVSIDLKLVENTNNGWTNIFGFRQRGAEPLKSGFRIPAVLMINDKNTGRTKLHICTDNRDRGNFCWEPKEENPIPFNEWFNLTLKQEKNDEGNYEYSISMGGQELRRWVNTHPMTFENVDGLIANTYSDVRFDKAPAGINRFKNFRFTSSP